MKDDYRSGGVFATAHKIPSVKRGGEDAPATNHTPPTTLLPYSKNPCSKN